MRVIVRRPHAYTFRAERGGEIPGIALLDGDGELVGAVGLLEDGARDALLAAMARVASRGR
ncbi:MAG: hypothetical protein HY720_29875 [Planctomycetes bacterium]|nr:hypothetical protein [Planctomycetota bacterium]